MGVAFIQGLPVSLTLDLHQWMQVLFFRHGLDGCDLRFRRRRNR